MNSFGRLGWAFALLGAGGAPEAVTKLDIPRMRAPPPCMPREPMGAATGAGAGAGGRAVLPMVRKPWRGRPTAGLVRRGKGLGGKSDEVTVVWGSEKSSSLGTVMDPGIGGSDLIKLPVFFRPQLRSIYSF